MKKIFVCLAFLLFFYGMNKPNAALMTHRLGMYMLVNNKKEEVIFYEDLETRMPVFRLSYENDDKVARNYQEVSEISITKEEEAKIKIILAALIEGKKYIEMDWLHVVGAQTLIWEVLQNHFTTSYSYLFETPFLDEYRELVAKKEEELSKKEIFEYNTTITDPLKINFLPNFSHPYEIKPVNNNIQITKENNEFVLQIKEEGTYEFQVESDYFDDQVKYFSNETIEVIELVKPKIPSPIIKVNALKEENPHEVIILPTNGIELFIEKKHFFKNDLVSFTYNLKNDYELKEIKIRTKDGTEIKSENNTFIMPDEDIIIETITSKKEISYEINTKLASGIFANIPKQAKEKEVITLDYEINKEYILENIIIVTASGKKISITNNSFHMPNEDLKIEFITRKKEVKYSILTNNIPDINLKVEPSAKEKEEVKFSYQDKEKIWNIKVFTINNEEIEVKNNSFIMPSSTVYFEVTKMPEIHDIIIIENPYVTFQMPSSSKEGEKIKLNYKVKEGYELEEIFLFTKTKKEILEKDQFFEMPKEDIFVMPITRQKKLTFEIPNTKKNQNLFPFLFLFVTLGLKTKYMHKKCK